MFDLRNMTTVNEFTLLSFSLLPHLIVPVFCLILMAYIFIMLGNFLIVFLVLMDSRIQRPMYFFLCNLAVIDLFFVNTTIPNLLMNLTRENKIISLNCCLTQSYFFFVAGTAEFLLLAVMSFDRYLAICYPLHYPAVMSQRPCIWLIIAVWFSSFVSTCIPSYLVMKLKFCFSEIDHFFCDIGPLLMNSCTSTANIEKCIVASSSPMIISFLVTVISYINIIIAIIKVNTSGGKQKIITTCSSHAIVVTLAYGSCIYLYSQPTHNQEFDLNKRVSIVNTMVVPLINPFIYTLRNKNFKECVHDVILRLIKN
uniref:Olfactory receptor n=1 Tax=Pyxicephalus adspersus TaxID=30357 RepID=A0AAV3AJA5_PYXAD|nr:TPA: hypothetical protein GDO54_013900 [Pyxicephalus adspersus]